MLPHKPLWFGIFPCGKRFFAEFLQCGNRKRFQFYGGKTEIKLFDNRSGRLSPRRRATGSVAQANKFAPEP